MAIAARPPAPLALCGCDVIPVVDLRTGQRRAITEHGQACMKPVRHVVHAAGGLDVDLDRCEARRGGQPVYLTPNEWRILARLAQDIGRVVTHRAMIGDVWDAPWTDIGLGHALRTHVARLRARIGPGVIETRVGIGYLLLPGERA